MILKFKYIPVLLLLPMMACNNENPFLNEPISSSQSALFQVSSVDGMEWDMLSKSIEPYSNNTMLRGDTVEVDDDMIVIAQVEDRNANYNGISRGVPIMNAAQLKTMGVSVFKNVNETSDYTDNTPLWKTVKADNNVGSWVNSTQLVWPATTSKLSFFAYSPYATSGAGMTVAATGRTLTYKAPTDVTKQPDICWAAPIYNRALNIEGNHVLSFAMQHRLASVGIKASGNKVKIKSVIIYNVASTGTLNLKSGGWSNVSGETNFTLGVKQSLESIPIIDITNDNGYLLVPPQTLNDASMLTFVFDDLAPGGKTNITKSVSLKSFSSVLRWDAGKRYFYSIQLKANFPITIDTRQELPPEAGNSEVSFSTNSPLPVTVSTNVTWIKNISLNNVTKKITFSYDKIEGEYQRNGKIIATTGHGRAETAISQSPPYIRCDYIYDMLPIQPLFNYKTTVRSNCSWTASGNHVTIWPASGGPGETVVNMSVSKNVGPPRRVAVNFHTTILNKYDVWAANQDSYFCGRALETSPNVYVRRDNQEPLEWGDAVNRCNIYGCRLPSVNELLEIYRNKSSYNYYATLHSGDDDAYWSNEYVTLGFYYQVYMKNGYWNRASKYYDNYVRCVKQF